jgi:hypothetical protein
MALHPDFPDSPHESSIPAIRWFPADEALRETRVDKLMPPLVAQLRKKVKEFRDGGYVGATDTSKQPAQLVVQHAAHCCPRPMAHGRVPILLRAARGAGDDHLSLRRVGRA